MYMSNPFDKYEAEDYDMENVYEMFVDDKIIINELEKPRHHFIWGSRGSGKSMLLRYFEPYCQFKVYGGWEKHFISETSFIGIYCPIPRGLLSNDKFEKIDPYIAEIVSSHMFNMLVAESIMRTICEQLNDVKIDEPVKMNFVNSFIQIIVPKESQLQQTDECFDRKNNPLLWVYEFIKQEKRRIVKYVQFFPFTKEEYGACITDYHDFIVPFIRSVKELLSFRNSLFIMFDDAGFLSENIQKKINTWISNRNHIDINIKIASEQLYYKSFLTNDGQIIEKVNDFEDIYLDWRETTENKSFENNTFMIAEKRLSTFKMDTTDIRVLFPEDEEQKKLLCLAREEAINQLNTKGSHIKDAYRYINRISVHLLHKKLAEKRIPRNYAGYNYIINLAFGNIRSFLRLSRYILEAAKTDVGLDAIKKKGYFVEPSIQNKAITDFSKKEFEDIKSYKPGEYQSTLDGLHTIINSLCEYFKFRLKNIPLVESGVTAFAIKNPETLDEQSKKIIRAAIRYRYLIRKTYKKKNGLGREDVFALNKLLIPAFSLEPSPFAGRIVLSKTTFEIGCTDTKRFITKIKDTEQAGMLCEGEQLSLFNLTILEASEDMEEYDEYNENDLSGLY